MSDEFNMWVHTGGKHNKFWGFRKSSNGGYIVRYGRIGTKGQTSSSYDPLTKSWEKEAKGYRRVTQTEYDMLELQAHILGNGNKFEQAVLVVVDKDNQGRPHLAEITPEEAVNPKYKPSMVVSFRLRDRTGTTEPFTIWFADDDVYELDGQRFALMRGGIHYAPSKTRRGFSLDGNRRITEGHRLYSLTEKLAEVIGRTVI